MTARPTKITDELYDYVVAHGATPDPIAQDLIDETQSTLGEDAIMQVAPDTAAFLTMLTKIVGVRVAVEVGTPPATRRCRSPAGWPTAAS